jgi:hypothetical protein
MDVPVRNILQILVTKYETMPIYRQDAERSARNETAVAGFEGVMADGMALYFIKPRSIISARSYEIRTTTGKPPATGLISLAFPRRKQVFASDCPRSGHLCFRKTPYRSPDSPRPAKVVRLAINKRGVAVFSSTETLALSVHTRVGRRFLEINSLD